ncbi:MAG: sensor histidine kinase [Campylobacteraceae bacterium]
MNSFSIRRKFFILAFIGFLALTCLTWISLDSNTKGFSNLSNMFDDFKKVQNLQSNFTEPLYQLREATLSLIMSPNDDYKKSVDEKILPLIEKLDDSFDNSPSDTYMLWKEYKTLVETTRIYSINNFDEGAFTNAVTSEREQFYILIENINAMQKQGLDDSQNTFLSGEKNYEFSKYVIIISSIFISFIALVFGSLIIRGILKSLDKVKSGLDSFFLYLSKPRESKNKTIIELDTKDEFGIMAKAINKQVYNIQTSLEQDYALIHEATATVQDLKDGKFGKRLLLEASSQRLNTLKNVMNDMIDNLEHKIQEELQKRTNQEKLLVQQSKLASMGNMLGNIAHQWRQPLAEINAILMEVETITKYDELTEEKLIQAIKSCYRVTEHMSNTISDFQNFFKPSKNKEYFSVEEACRKAVSIADASLKKHNILILFDVNRDSQILGYPNEFSHAILNIISNAKDAFIKNSFIQEKKIILNIKTGKKFTIIKIEDTAGGIKEDIIDKIFDPYFTTKHARQGTGIGLYMTKVIIENNMHGFIHVRNTDRGALFTIKIK